MYRSGGRRTALWAIGPPAVRGALTGDESVPRRIREQRPPWARFFLHPAARSAVHSRLPLSEPCEATNPCRSHMLYNRGDARPGRPLRVDDERPRGPSVPPTKPGRKLEPAPPMHRIRSRPTCLVRHDRPVEEGPPLFLKPGLLRGNLSVVVALLRLRQSPLQPMTISVPLIT